MFEGWDSFYLLIGGASGALIGLLFVVATLTAGRERSMVLRGNSLYMTPTLFHFAMVLVLSGMAMAPRLPPMAVGLIMAGGALYGIVYMTVVTVLIGRRRMPEPPHWTDKWCYGLIPAAGYAVLAAVAASVWLAPAWTAHATAVVLLVLLLASIRNAWDLVTWLAPGKDLEAAAADPAPTPPLPPSPSTGSPGSPADTSRSSSPA